MPVVLENARVTARRHKRLRRELPSSEVKTWTGET
jgi:hypothetical protein